MEIKTKFKGGEFLIKNFSFEDALFPERFTEDHQMIQNTVRNFVQQSVHKHGDDLDAQVSLLKEAGELGLVGAHIPEMYGGGELDFFSHSLISEELGGGSASFSTTFGAHTGIGMLPILYFGTEEQKQKYLPKLCSGELIAAYCLTEPGSGSDALGAKTIAILNEEKTHFLITGQKMWITNAGFADVFIVFAKIDHEQFTCFIVEKGTEGMTFGNEEHKLGIKASSTRQIFFEQARIPVQNILGSIGKGHQIAFNVLNMGRYKLGVLVCGGSKYITTIGLRYALERKQFDTEIAKFGAIQYKLAESAIRTYVLESSVYRIADLMEDWKNEKLRMGDEYKDALLNAAEEYAIECAILKVYGSEVIDYCTDECLQIHGGYGYSEEFYPAQLFRDTRINRIYEGTNEINRLLIINMLLRRVMKGELNMIDEAWAVQKELAGVPKIESISGNYGAQVKALSHFKKILLIVAGAAAKNQMEGKFDLKNEQEIVLNLADILIDVFNCESVLARLIELNKMCDIRLEAKESILKVFFHDAQDRISKNATDALASFASGDELKMMLLGVKRYTKLDPENVKKHRRIIAEKLIFDGSYSF